MTSEGCMPIPAKRIQLFVADLVVLPEDDECNESSTFIAHSIFTAGRGYPRQLP